jgi:lipopolysaccharide export LptBFGC system permease protein LptF
VFFVRTPFGRISWPSVVLVVVVLAVIVTGLIIPGRTGDLIAAGGLIAFAGIVIFELGGFWSVRRGSSNDRTPF